MTINDEHDNDSNLKSYLEGKDGVSATYRKVAGELPPAELDALILQAAAGAVAKPASHPGASRRQQYAMAASLCLGVLLTSLYYEQQVPQDTGPLIITASVDQRQIGELDFVTPKAADGGVAQEDIARAENFLAPAAPATTAVSSQAAQPAPQSTAVQIVVDEVYESRRRSPPVQGAVGQGARLLQEQTSPSVMVIPGQDEQRIVSVTTLNEAVVSAELRTQDLWLEEINRIASELESSASETETLRQRLSEERASFSAIYPDFDIDAALAE